MTERFVVDEENGVIIDNDKDRELVDVFDACNVLNSLNKAKEDFEKALVKCTFDRRKCE